MIINKDFIESIPYHWWNGDIGELIDLFEGTWGINFTKESIEHLLKDKNDAIFVPCEGFCDEGGACPMMIYGLCTSIFGEEIDEEEIEEIDEDE